MAQFDISDEDIDDDEKLDQDYDTPLSIPGDSRGRITPDHPSTDTGLDEHELYDEGLSGAAEINDGEEEDII
jgi:hypothetical protein